MQTLRPRTRRNSSGSPRNRNRDSPERSLERGRIRPCDNGARPRGSSQKVMARAKPRGSEIYVDDDDMRVLFDALKTVDVELRKSTNAQLRIAAKECAEDLARRLKIAAYAEPAPQTRLVAESIKTMWCARVNM